VRATVERWVDAVQARDLDGVIDRHGEDIVMFDVPPPEAGRRGAEAYAASWPPFFDWIAQGARFELDELHVEAGADVAFAWALLRCGTEANLRDAPDRRLRLSFGLRRRDGEWHVLHEHHSFTHADG
jgi:uncharacterized protein (TIGR02246 family)